MTTDVNRLADLIAGGTRVRVGDVEGVLDGFTSRYMYLVVDGERVEVAAADVVELEPVDEARVAAHWAARAEADALVLAERATRRARADLASMGAADFASVIGDPAVSDRILQVAAAITTKREA